MSLDIDQATQGSSTELGASGGGPITSGGGSGNGVEQPNIQDNGISIQTGNAPSSYDYQIVAQNAAIGGSYVASHNSNITSNGCVAVFSRLSSFLITNTSSASINACSAYVGNFGFAASKASSIDVISSVSCIHKFNYFSGNNSAVVTKYSQSLFPFDFSQYASFNSSITNLEFETVTRWWDDDSGANATHFGSVASSYVQNQSTALSNLNVPSGFSGGIVGTQPLRFIWSEVFRPASANIQISNLGNPGYASYNYVPFAHSIDYNNFNTSGNVSSSATSFSTHFPGLAALISYRNNYQSVKPPTFMSAPEDGSAATETSTLVTTSYSLATLVNNGIGI